MDVALIQRLVEKQKEISEKLNGFRAEITQHESAIEAVYAKAEPLSQESRRVQREMFLALGFSVPDPQAGAPVEG